MNKVLLCILNTMLADAIKKSLEITLDFSVDKTCENDQKIIQRLIDENNYNTILLDISCYSSRTFNERIELTKIIKNKCPNLKVVFISNETLSINETNKIIEAKKFNVINAFLSESVSLDYLVMVFKSL